MSFIDGIYIGILNGYVGTYSNDFDVPDLNRVYTKHEWNTNTLFRHSYSPNGKLWSGKLLKLDWLLIIFIIWSTTFPLLLVLLRVWLRLPPP